MAKQQQTIIGRKIRYAPAAALQFALLCAVHCCADSAVQCSVVVEWDSAVDTVLCWNRFC